MRTRITLSINFILIKTMIVGAAIYTVITLILAGYAFISAGGDPKRIQEATSRIWQALIGLIVAAGSIIIAAIIGTIFFGDATALLQVRYFTP